MMMPGAWGIWRPSGRTDLPASCLCYPGSRPGWHPSFPDDIDHLRQLAPTT